MAKKIRLLIVEDEIIIAADLENRLQKLGYDLCGQAVSSERALELVQAQKPDLVLMDISLQGETDGIDTAEIIKNKWGIPVIFLTAYADMEKIERIKGIHPFGYILKPFQDRELKVTIELALYASQVDAERRKAEWALRESEKKANKYLEIAGVAILALDSTGSITMINKRGLEILGYKHEELLGKNWFTTCLPERSREDVLGVFQQLMKGEIEPIEYYENPVLRKDGTERIIAWHNAFFQDSFGVITGILSSGEDITERKQAEEELRNSQAELEQILEALPEGLAYTDRERRIIRINSAFTRIFGYNIEEVIGKKTEILYARSEDFVEQGRKRYNVHARDMHSPYEIEYRRKNGEVFPGETVGTPVRDAQDRVIGFIGLIRDITTIKHSAEERERLQEQLQQAQKMEAVGTLAGGIAHDFNNLLQAISGYAQLILMDTDKESPIYGNLTGISTASQRAKELIQQLLLFSRKVEAERRPVELNRIIEHAYKILERTIPKMIEIELNLAGRLWNVKADSVQMEQILLNLGKNAADSMPDGGKLTIETENTIIKEDYVQIHLGMRPGCFVLLTVSDTGHGMDKDTLEHIFEPFYTTKEIGRGTGLGLASIYGIVKSHGGNITCYSEVNLGTVFKIYLPAIEEEEIETREEIDPELPQRGTETVLLVDDEESIRDFVSQALVKFGYTAHTASSGEEALEIYARTERGDRFNHPGHRHAGYGRKQVFPGSNQDKSKGESAYRQRIFGRRPN